MGLKFNLVLHCLGDESEDENGDEDGDCPGDEGLDKDKDEVELTTRSSLDQALHALFVRSLVLPLLKNNMFQQLWPPGVYLLGPNGSQNHSPERSGRVLEGSGEGAGTVPGGTRNAPLEFATWT